MCELPPISCVPKTIDRSHMCAVALAPTLKEGSIASARRYASSPASGSPSCPRHNAIMFQSVLESTLDFTTSLKSDTARPKYRNCDRVSRGHGENKTLPAAGSSKID